VGSKETASSPCAKMFRVSPFRRNWGEKKGRQIMEIKPYAEIM